MVSSIGSTPQTTTPTSSESKSRTELNTNYETFLNLLTAQIKNQDPLSPMDTTEWTNQLVQYSSVEQQLKSNEYLKAIADQGANTMSSAVNYIGKDITADIDTQAFKDKPLEWRYDLGSDASKVEYEIKNSTGDVVFKGEASGKASGEHSLTWNGKDASGKTLKSGNYSLSIIATTSGGSNVASAVSVEGRVDATELVNNEVVVRLGQSLIPLKYISGVSLKSAA
jgi:flagellar basal-body rod modification protein FlgD